MPCGGGCRSVQTNDVSDRLLPSNFRDWAPEFATLPYAEFDGDRVVVHNIRNNEYLSDDDFVVQHYDREYDLSQLQTVDFFVVPFTGYEFMAHTMVSFGFADGNYLAISAEIRTEKGEKYSPIAGVSRQFEITYVVADEKDVVRVRTRYRDADVYLYRTIATPEKARELFVDMMGRVNQLAAQPEFYDTITNNCTTNIVRHVNRVLPNRIPYSLEVLLPGFSDRYAYELGLLDRSVPFDELKRRAWINDLSEKYYDDPDYSNKIRQRLEPAGSWLSPPEEIFDQPAGSDLIPIAADERLPHGRGEMADAETDKFSRPEVPRGFFTADEPALEEAEKTPPTAWISRGFQQMMQGIPSKRLR